MSINFCSDKSSVNCQDGGEKIELAEVFDRLMDNYDMRERPYTVKSDGTVDPVRVRTSMYIYFLGHIAESQLSFETQLNIRHRWSDPRSVPEFVLASTFPVSRLCAIFRLRFTRANLTGASLWTLGDIKGESWYADRMWTPNLFIENGLSSDVVGMRRENVFIRIDRTGNVQLNYR